MARIRTADEEQILAQMSAIVASLHESERAALESDEQTSAARRRREHAQLSLRRQLIAHAILSG